MKLVFSKNEQELLKNAHIEFSLEKEYDDDEMFDLLDSVYEQEQIYSNFPPSNEKAYELANKYATLADKIQNSIPID